MYVPMGWMGYLKGPILAHGPPVSQPQSTLSMNVKWGSLYGIDCTKYIP